MHPHVRTSLKLAVSQGLAGTFLWAAFHTVDVRHTWQAAREARPVWLVLAALVLLLANAIRAWRWRVLMAPVASGLSLWRVYMAITIGYAANNVLPRAGEVVRVMALKQGEDVSISSLLATVLVERVIDMVALLVFFGAVLFGFRSQIADLFPWMEGVGLVALLVSILLLVVFGVLSAYGPRSLGFVERILGLLSQTLARRMVNILRSLFQGMEALRTPAGYVEIVLCTVLLYGCYTMMIYLPFFSFDFPERYGLGLPAAAVVIVISTVGIIIPTPGGTGTYHYFCSQTLHRIYGTPLPEALAFATVLHGTAYIVLLAAGGPGLLSLPSRRRAERRLDPEADS